jgi:hypothetical protein
MVNTEFTTGVMGTDDGVYLLFDETVTAGGGDLLRCMPRSVQLHLKWQ